VRWAIAGDSIVVQLVAKLGKKYRFVNEIRSLCSVYIFPNVGWNTGLIDNGVFKSTKYSVWKKNTSCRYSEKCMKRMKIENFYKNIKYFQHIFFF